jgi:hypothetical protein
MTSGEKLWRRAGIEAAIGTKLLPTDVPVFFSELDLSDFSVLPYDFGISLGRVAGDGTLPYDMHPENIGFDGEGVIPFDFGKTEHVEVSATSLLPWLADLRANWKHGFGALLAGILQGLRVKTAVTSPSLVKDLVGSLGGRGVNESEWPIRVCFVEALSTVRLTRDGKVNLGDFRSFAAISMDRSEQSCFDMLATTMGGATRQSILTRAVPLEVDFSKFVQLLKSDQGNFSEFRRSLWLLAFILVYVNERLIQDEEVPIDATMLQAAYFAIQRFCSDSRYVESLLIVCCYSEIWRKFCRSNRRLGRAEVFSILGYVSSSSLAHLGAFRGSMELVRRREAESPLWSAVWTAINRIRGFEAAFAVWAGEEPEAFSRAAPGLMALANAQGALITAVVSTVAEFADKSIRVPWSSFFEQEKPNLESEIHWCKQLLAIVKESAKSGIEMAGHFKALPTAVNLKGLGIHEMSFVFKEES